MGFWRKKTATAGWTALVMAPRRIDVARVRRRAGARPLIETLESYERGSDDAQALARLRKKYDLAGARCTTLLAPGSYQLVPLDLPGGADAEVDMAIREKLKDSLDYPVEHATLDHFEIPVQGAGRSATAYAVAASNAVVAPRVRAFEAARVPLEVIDIPEMAQRNIAALCEEPGRGLVFLSFDESGGLLTLTANGELYSMRRIEISLDQLMQADEDRRASLFDRVGLEVQRSLDNFDRQFSTAPVNRVLLGPHPLAEAMLAFLRDYLSMPVEVLDLAQVADFPSLPELNQPSRQAQCLLAIGAALREELL